MAYRLFITDKNYSSWSMRIWVLLRALDIPFDEELVPIDWAVYPGPQPRFLRFSPAGKVPCLHDASAPAAVVVWDSLAIVEYLAERHPGRRVWPLDSGARAFARSAAAEMHASFSALRSEMSMNIAARLQLPDGGGSEALQRDLVRLGRLFAEGLRRFGGPWLAGAEFGAVDAFFVPVASRLVTYAVQLEGEGVKEYLGRLLDVECVREWCEDGRKEVAGDKAA